MMTKSRAALLPLLLSLSFFMADLVRSEGQLPDNQMPDWLSKRLDPEHRGLLGPPVQVIKFVYKDASAYYLVSPCCDMSNQVYAESGEYICTDGIWSNPNLTRPCRGLGIEPRKGVLIWAIDGAVVSGQQCHSGETKMPGSAPQPTVCRAIELLLKPTRK